MSRYDSEAMLWWQVHAVDSGGWKRWKQVQVRVVLRGV